MRNAIILAALVWVLTPQAVANKCAAEASFAVHECACTVVNRITEGWNPARVLSAYYAPSITATEAQVATVAAVLDGRTMCGAEYFIYSLEDVADLGYGHYTPVAVVQDGDKAVVLFSRWFRREQ